MSQELNSVSVNEDNGMWQPTASKEAIIARAQMYKTIRDFFAKRNVLEVETPLMCYTAVTDPFINAFKVNNKYLQTSPEYAMKRLLAADIGDMYQICKAFRDDESGSMHNSEFTMLEWYRLGFDDFQLMNETDLLLQEILNCSPAKIISYKEIFEEHLNINPHTADITQLMQLAKDNNIDLSNEAQKNLNVTDWLQIIMSNIIEPKLTGDSPWIIYNFPAKQAALAKVINRDGIDVAARFEVYINGLELSNGYYELQDSKEQYSRFINDNKTRANLNLPEVPIDTRLVEALDSGLPNCAGIALGLDRVLMLKLQAKTISQVLCFDINNA